MAKMKYWDSVAAAWKTLDAANGDTVDGIHFRINGGKLQYSTDGTTWVNTGVDTSDATAAAGDIKTGKNAYVNGVKVAGTMPVRTNTDTGGSYPVAVNQSIYPGMLYLSPPAGYYDGNVWVQSALANMTAANIKAGVQFSANLTGTFTADATATAADIISGKTAYVNGAKLTGTATAGKKFASGIATVNSNPLTVTGLAFRPRVVLAWNETWGYNIAVASSFMNTDWDAARSVSIGASDPASAARTSSGFSVSASGFTMSISALGSGVKWVAFE